MAKNYRKTASGRFSVSIRRNDKPIYRTFDTELEAKQFVIDVQKTIKHLQANPTDRSLRNMVMQYLLHDDTKEKKSFAQIELRANKIMREHSWLTDLPIGNITVKDLEKFKSELKAKKLQANTVKHYFSLLNQTYKHAIRVEQMPLTNIVGMVKLEKPRNERDRVLSLKEYEELLKVLPDWLEPIVSFAYYTGARQAEILKLKFETVDFEKRTAMLLDTKNNEDKNRNNDKAHLFWRIDGFVCHEGNTPPKLLSLWNDCKSGLNFTLDGDLHFSDGFTKNPLSGDFIIQTRHDPSPYRLGDFISDLAFPEKTRRYAKRIGGRFNELATITEGCRNKSLFDNLRFYAYNNKWRFVEHGRQAFYDEILFMGLEANQLFPTSLPKEEVLDTTRSIVKFVWDKRPDKWLVCPEYKDRGVCHRLGLIQPDMSLNERQSIGAEHTNDQRKQNSEEAIIRAVEQLKTSGQRVSVAEVAKMAGISRISIYRYYRGLVEA